MIYLLEDFSEIAHGGGGFLVERLVFGQFAHGPFSFVDFSDNIPGLVDGGLDVGRGIIHVRDRGQGRGVKRVFVDQPADGALALGDLG